MNQFEIRIEENRKRHRDRHRNTNLKNGIIDNRICRIVDVNKKK